VRKCNCISQGFVFTKTGPLFFETTKFLAGTGGIEPTFSVLETEVLPLNDVPIKDWSLGRELNSRLLPYHGSVLPLNYPGILIELILFGAERGIRTPGGIRQLIYSQLQLATLVSRLTHAKTNFSNNNSNSNGAKGGDRTHNLRFTKPLLYH
jgi:hypothetical protein